MPPNPDSPPEELQKELTAAWGIIFAMEGQEPWPRAQDWLTRNYQFRPPNIVGAEMFKPKD
jgi:hypothetical protein